MYFICQSQLRYLFFPVFLILLLAITFQTAQAQTKGTKITICQEIEGRKPGENTGAGLRAIKPTNMFELGGLDSFAILLEFPPFNEPTRINIEAFRSSDAGEFKAFGDAIIVSRTDTKAYVIGTFSQLGKYTVKATCDDKLIAQETFTVATSTNPPRGILSICKDVDNNLNPVGTATVFPSGTPVKFHATFPRHNGQRFIFWTIFKIDKDGKDESYVDNFQMSVKAEWKTFAIDDTYTFSEPGQYRVYILDYEQGNSSDKSGNYDKYLAKTDITIK